MSILTRPILEINLDNLTENYLTLQKISGKATAAAVVKDDAYGLDAAKVAGILYRRAKCRHFLWPMRLKDARSEKRRLTHRFMFCRESVKILWLILKRQN